MKKTKKKTAKNTANRGAVPQTMSLTKLIGELAKAISEPLGSDERRVISMRIANAKQKKPAKKRKR